MRYLVYLHGFNSSPQSEKARLTLGFFNAHYPELEIVVPALPPEPKSAMSLVEEIVLEKGVNGLAGFIGSSLGGYYSLYLQSRYDVPIVLINPAIRPYELLSDYIGENTNMYTGEVYIVKPEHMDDLKALKVTVTSSPQKHYLLTQTGDEVLDYSQAVAALPNAKASIVYGGDHAFQHYASYLPGIARFFE